MRKILNSVQNKNTALRNFLRRNLKLRSVRLDRRVTTFDKAFRKVQQFLGIDHFDEPSWSRFCRVNSLPRVSDLDLVDLPRIELLIVVAEKDFKNLPLVVASALDSSLNQIERLVFVLPDKSLKSFNNLFEYHIWGVNFEVLLDSNLIDSNLLEDIRNLVGRRAGWFIQQLLKVECVKRSNSKGVLVLDADTLLIEKRAWLDKHGRQILMPTWEYHQPYYEFLSKVFGISEKFVDSFVSHHMLMQPTLLQKILQKSELGNLASLWQKILAESDLRGSSPVCIEYELYSQGVILEAKDSVTFVKWGNINYVPDSSFFAAGGLVKIQNHYKSFGSISLHTYLT
jgi:hypothetical protein